MVKRDAKGHFVKKTLAAKIRELNAKGMPRAEIARTLGIRYQRVRNVLVPRVKPVEVELVEFDEADEAELEAVTESSDTEPLEAELEELEAELEAVEA
jgi:hypothetical protein